MFSRVLSAGCSGAKQGTAASKASEPLKVDPTELRLTAGKLDGHASGFRTAHETAQSRASKTALGSGLAAAALPAMLEAWESDGAV